MAPTTSADPDLYARLNLTHTATAADIKRAYRSLALRSHPDKGGDEASAGAQKFLLICLLFCSRWGTHCVVIYLAYPLSRRQEA